MKKLRIAQISTLWEKTPPSLYGGTERIASGITEELVKRGHEVTLFATGDSETSGKLESVYPRALYRDGIPWTSPLYPLLHITNAMDKANQFDIIHMHFNTRQDYVSLALSKYIKTPMVFTIHFVLPGEDEKEKQDRLALLKKYKDRNFISISKNQQSLKWMNFIGTAYNGIDFSNFTFNDKPKDYLAWIGRFCNDKGAVEAIQVAKKVGKKLMMAGKIDWANPDFKKYYEEEVKPQIDGKKVEYIGEVGEKEKIDLYSNAYALLNPIKWQEPFGLVTVEAMACGTPVIAFNNGPVKEQIIEGKTGFIVPEKNDKEETNIDGMAEAVGKIDSINRKDCQKQAVDKFSVESMVNSYEELYQKAIAKNKN
ncbi:MAG: glycosyltransferase family 4 protein [bacterium]